MIIFGKQAGADRATSYTLRDVTAEKISMTLEPGESFVLNTPIGQLSIERTADTFSAVCEDGYVAFSAEIHEDSGLWRRDIPLTIEEADRRRVEFAKEEMDCQDKIGEPIGVLVGTKFVCTECASATAMLAGEEPPTKVYRNNIGSYKQTCSRCGVVVVEGKTAGWPNLF